MTDGREDESRPERTGALVVTDIVDSTALVDRHGDAATDMYGRHDARVRELFHACGGREIAKTDGFVLAFPDVRSALEFTRNFHRALAEIGESFGLPFASRVGVGSYDRELDRVPDDARRDAERLMDLADGSHTLVDAALLGSCDDPENSSKLLRRGFYRFRGRAEPIDVWEVRAPSGFASEPPPDSRNAFRVRRDGEFWVPAGECPHNLSGPPDELVDRGDEVSRLSRRLQSDAKLVTVKGVAGVGKTHLARHVAWRTLGLFRGGTFFCDLAEATTIASACRVIAEAIGIDDSNGKSVERVARALDRFGECLVVLDGLETSADRSNETVGTWLELAPDTTFLVTSQHRLHLPGERLFELEPILHYSGESLDAALERSWNLLDPYEQTVLAQMSVFDGGVTLEVAESTIDLPDEPEAPFVFDIVEALVDKSFIEVDSTPDAGRSFILIPPVRQFALSKLAAELADQGLDAARSDRVPSARRRLEEAEAIVREIELDSRTELDGRLTRLRDVVDERRD